MINPRLKTRSDYHRSYSSEESIDFLIMNRLFKIFLWLAFGFALGIVYTKMLRTTSCEELVVSPVEQTENAQLAKEDQPKGSPTVSKV